MRNAKTRPRIGHLRARVVCAVCVLALGSPRATTAQDAISAKPDFKLTLMEIGKTKDGGSFLLDRRPRRETAKRSIQRKRTTNPPLGR